MRVWKSFGLALVVVLGACSDEPNGETSGHGDADVSGQDDTSGQDDASGQDDIKDFIRTDGLFANTLKGEDADTQLSELDAATQAALCDEIYDTLSTIYVDEEFTAHMCTFLGATKFLRAEAEGETPEQVCIDGVPQCGPDNSDLGPDEHPPLGPMIASCLDELAASTETVATYRSCATMEQAYLMAFAQFTCDTDYADAMGSFPENEDVNEACQGLTDSAHLTPVFPRAVELEDDTE